MSEPEAWEPIVYPVVRQRASIFRQIVKRAEGGDTQIDPVLRLSHSRVAICDAYELSARTGCCCAGKACPLSCRPRLPSPAGRKLGEATRGSQRPGAHPDYVRGRLARVGVGKLGASSTRRRSPYSRTAATDLKCRGCWENMPGGGGALSRAAFQSRPHRQTATFQRRITTLRLDHMSLVCYLERRT